MPGPSGAPWSPIHVFRCFGTASPVKVSSTVEIGNRLSCQVLETKVGMPRSLVRSTYVSGERRVPHRTTASMFSPFSKSRRICCVSGSNLSSSSPPVNSISFFTASVCRVPLSYRLVARLPQVLSATTVETRLSWSCAATSWLIPEP